MSFPASFENETDPYRENIQRGVQALFAPAPLQSYSTENQKGSALKAAAIREKSGKSGLIISKHAGAKVGVITRVAQFTNRPLDRLIRQRRSLSGETILHRRLQGIRWNVKDAGIEYISVDPPYPYAEDAYKNAATSYKRVVSELAKFHVIVEKSGLDIATRAEAGEITAAFLGRVEAITEGQAIVSLVNEKTNDRLEAECDPTTLKKQGIGEGDEFRCEVVQNDYGVSVRFHRLRPKKISAQEVASIIKEVGDLTL